MKLTSKGQVTIPIHIRRYLGVEPRGEVTFEIVEGQVVLSKMEPTNRGEQKSRFARLRGCARGKLTTDAWMQATRGE